MSDETPHPDAGGTPTRREVTIRDGPDEHVWVHWFVGGGSCFTSILSEDDRGELRFLTLDSNELSQLVLALRTAKQTGLYDTKDLVVRDLGIERVYIDESATCSMIVVEEVGEVDRMLVLDDDEIDDLIDAIERAEDELPRTEDDAHV